MLYELLAQITAFIVYIISYLGYPGIFFLMALESACLPVPSEIIMPFAGYLTLEGKFAFWPVVLMGTFGNLAGSLIAYFFGYYGGRVLIEKYGRYILISSQELARSEHFFKKYGHLTVFIGRLLPVIRTFISLPAGIAGMDLKKFIFYTTIGSLPWSIVLTYLGILFGENWSGLEVYFRKFDWLVGLIIILIIGWWICKNLKLKMTPKKSLRDLTGQENEK